MSQADLPEYAQVNQDARRYGLGIDAAELHGSVCGYLSAGGELRPETWLHQLQFHGADPALPRGSALEALLGASRTQLQDQQLGFDLLLPPTSAPLAERADRLLDWCRGFLGGFGLAGSDRARLGAEADEALGDLAKIAASRLAYEDPEEDESALAEVTEFVRIAVMLLYGECVLAAQSRQRLH